MVDQQERGDPLPSSRCSSLTAIEPPVKQDLSGSPLLCAVRSSRYAVRFDVVSDPTLTPTRKGSLFVFFVSLFTKDKVSFVTTTNCLWGYWGFGHGHVDFMNL